MSRRLAAAKAPRAAVRHIADLGNRARSTFSIACSLTGAERLITADTVEMATPARFATSLIVDTSRAPCQLVVLHAPMRNVSCWQLPGKWQRCCQSARSGTAYTKRFVLAATTAFAPRRAQQGGLTNDHDFTPHSARFGRRSRGQRRHRPRLRAVGRHRDAAAPGLRRRRRARRHQQRHRPLQREVPQRHGRGVDRPDLDRLGRLRDQGASASSTRAARPTSTAPPSRPSRPSPRAASGCRSTIYVAANTGFSDFAPSLFEQGSATRGTSTTSRSSWNNIMINYNRDLFDAAGVAYPERRLDLGRVPRDRQGADGQGRLRHRHPVRLRGAEPELLRPALVLLQRHRRR